ncbi:MAG: hypothetical protein CMM07_13545 [Rhodopirellula sp.]|nr:hypothetical protein [Rhodopirellula sp.]
MFRRRKTGFLQIAVKIVGEITSRISRFKRPPAQNILPTCQDSCVPQCRRVKAMKFHNTE